MDQDITDRRDFTTKLAKRRLEASRQIPSEFWNEKLYATRDEQQNV